MYLGVDNIADLFMPLVDGDMWVECRFLMEALRFYDLDSVSSIAWFGSVVLALRGPPNRKSKIRNR